MADFDYTLKENPKKVHSVRKHICFYDIFHRINKVERLSVFAFPDGKKINKAKLKRRGYRETREYAIEPILPEIAKEEISATEQWAEFLGAFTPGTSYMDIYDEILSIEGEETPMCEFRLEQPKDFETSQIIRQCWLNGVRYCYEEPFPDIARFCLAYWKKDMEKYQAFQIYLLAHNITSGVSGHETQARNPYFQDKESYEKLVHEPTKKQGTKQLGKGHKLDKSYKVVYNKSALAVQQALKDIKNKKEPLAFETLIEMWKNEK